MSAECHTNYSVFYFYNRFRIGIGFSCFPVISVCESWCFSNEPLGTPTGKSLGSCVLCPFRISSKKKANELSRRLTEVCWLMPAHCNISKRPGISLLQTVARKPHIHVSGHRVLKTDICFLCFARVISLQPTY